MALSQLPPPPAAQRPRLRLPGIRRSLRARAPAALGGHGLGDAQGLLGLLEVPEAAGLGFSATARGVACSLGLPSDIKRSMNMGLLFVGLILGIRA